MARTNKNTDDGPQVNILKYRKGEQIIKQGDYGISIYIILRGKVEIFRESEEREVPLAVLGHGDTIGEMEFLEGAKRPRTASLVASGDVWVGILDVDRLIKDYQLVPPKLRILIRSLMAKYKETTAKLCAKVGTPDD